MLGFLVGVDQTSKLWANHQGWAVINRGISFSWLSGQISWLGILVLIAAGGFWWWRLLPKQRPAVILILAGAISNLIDRIVWGGVVDWLPIPFLGLKNNLADWAIFIGVWLVILKEICKYRSFLKIKI